MTIKEIREKYCDIEDKIPSIFEDYKKAGYFLAQDIMSLPDGKMWDISDGELIRVISLIGIRGGPKLYEHINPLFAFAGLYPARMKSYNVNPEVLNNINDLIKERRKVADWDNMASKDLISQIEELEKEIGFLREDLNSPLAITEEIITNLYNERKNLKTELKDKKDKL